MMRWNGNPSIHEIKTILQTHIMKPLQIDTCTLSGFAKNMLALISSCKRYLNDNVMSSKSYEKRSIFVDLHFSNIEDEGTLAKLF